MNLSNARNRGILLILLLLPAPLTAIAVILGFTLLIADPDAISLGDDDEVADAPAVEPEEPTLDPQVIALATVNAVPTREVAAVPAQPVEVSSEGFSYSQEMIDAGQVNFLSTCSACHNTDATGISGLGKPLVGSEFVRARTDEQLFEFIIVGRQSFEPDNTTGVTMPPRGGNPGLNDEDIHEIIAYIRVLDGVPAPDTGVEVAGAPTTSETTTTSSEPSAPVAAVEPPEPFVYVEVSTLLASLGVSLPDPLPQPELSAEELYTQRCAVCHGENGEGVEFFGPSLRESDVLSDHDMIFHIIEYGVPVWLSENETGVHMPAQGGYPALTEAQIEDLIAYLQTFSEAE